MPEECFADLAQRTAEAFRSLFERGVGVGTVRAAVDLLDLLLALQMVEVLASETDPDNRVRRHKRGGRVLMRGLFTDDSVTESLALVLESQDLA